MLLVHIFLLTLLRVPHVQLEPLATQRAHVSGRMTVRMVVAGGEEDKPDDRNATAVAIAYYLLGMKTRGESTTTDMWPMTVHLGCGTGLHTPLGAIGVDDCIAHIRLARQLYPGSYFVHADARIFGATDMCDTVLCRNFASADVWCEADIDTVLSNAVRIARRIVVVIDERRFKAQLQPIVRRVAAGRRCVEHTSMTQVEWTIHIPS